jgi:AraC-like DNA-binding protein
LERESGLNQKRIQKGFKRFFGLSVNKYIKNIRLSRAKELIETTDMSISEIVYAIGLNSRSYFSRIFVEKYGILPNNYRRNYNTYNPIFELSYYSNKESHLTIEDFNDVLHNSRERNRGQNITGCLVYHNNHFFQLLEGPKEAVLEVYESIQKDSRHRKVTTIYEGFKSGRTFEKWEMAFCEKPSLFSNTCLSDFKLLNIEVILKVYKNKPKDQSNKLRTKMMWERCRNALLVLDDKEKDLSVTKA